MDWAEIGKWLLAVVAALAVAGFAFKFVFVRKKTTNKTRTVTQTNNKAGRDIIGGDSIDNSKRK